MSASRDLPYPPFDLATRVFTLASDDLAGFVQYEMMGTDTRRQLVSMLPDGFSFEGRSILDFGCGAGRTLRHFHDEANGARFVGCDIDAHSIEWLSENLSPPFEALRSDVDPPLPFEDGSFDLIWAISVFTHLTENSAAWLLELHRLLKPDGMLMASYMGEVNSEDVAGEPWDADQIGMNVLRHSQSWDQGGPMVLMSDWWVEEHWGRAFNILIQEPFAGQTWALLEKRNVELSTEDLLNPSDDPREYRALRHNIRQLQAEIDGLKSMMFDQPVPERDSARRRVGRLRRLRG